MMCATQYGLLDAFGQSAQQSAPAKLLACFDLPADQPGNSSVYRRSPSFREAHLAEQ
jgi:hypothetical protein